MQLSVSAEGIALIKQLEGFRPEPAKLPDGRWLVGHGSVLLSPPGEPVTPQLAHDWLIRDLAPIEDFLRRAVHAPLTQAQFDALTSFVFAVGADAFTKSEVLRRLNAGEPIAAACAMDAYRKSSAAGETQVVDALVRRRAIEKALFLSLPEPIAAPSAFLRVEIDHAAAILSAPREVAPTPTPDDVQSNGDDEVARRLATIIAADPRTAHALKPAPKRLEPEGDEEPPMRGELLLKQEARSEESAADVLGLAIIAVMGAALVAAGGVGFFRGDALLVIVAAPGFVMLAMGLWALLRKSPERLRRNGR